MPDLFTTLVAKIVTDADGTHTDLLNPSGTLHTRIRAGQTQPKFRTQRFIMLNQQYYRIAWTLTPQTPRVQ